MGENNKMNQGQNDLNKSQKPGMGGEQQVSNQDPNKGKVGQNPKIGQDADLDQRQQSSNRPNQGGQPGQQGNQGNQGNIDRDSQK